MRILVLEDEPLLSMLLEESLAELGHELAGTVATVDQAFAKLEEGPVELALLDFSLGHDTTSAPVARKLHRDGIPFIYLTGHHTLDESEGDVPAAPLLKKPFSIAQLDSAIREVAPAD
ncbi:response regulator [Novosphingobium tardum]|uniref:Response regulator n=1 Tax=Novosphingobium tardum TaxID=1538021 RepID=A0ABV8RKP5_9SPHN